MVGELRIRDASLRTSSSAAVPQRFGIQPFGHRFLIPSCFLISPTPYRVSRTRVADPPAILYPRSSILAARRGTRKAAQKP